MKKSTSKKIGFKQMLEDAEDSDFTPTRKKKKKFKPNTTNYDNVRKQSLAEQLGEKTGSPKDLKLKKVYKRGRKDMDTLLGMFSLTFCKQFVFFSGFSRKTAQSDPKLRAYCNGFCDRLVEGK